MPPLVPLAEALSGIKSLVERDLPRWAEQGILSPGGDISHYAGAWTGQGRMNSPNKGIVGFTDERLKNLYQQHIYPNGNSKGYVTYVNPEQFLEATTSRPEHRLGIRQEAGTLDPERLRAETQTPFLTTDGTSITGHEGRHRNVALGDYGFDRVPVVVENGKPQPMEPNLTQGYLKGEINPIDGISTFGKFPLTEDGISMLKEMWDKYKGPVSKYGIPLAGYEAYDAMNPDTSDAAYIGPKGLRNLLGKDAADSLLSKAEGLFASGKSNEHVRDATGIFKGMDEKLRYEIDDSAGKLYDGIMREPHSLVMDLDHPELFKAYPQFETMDFMGNVPDLGDYDGFYSPSKNLISLKGEDYSTLMHEIQHAIQETEGFSRGGTTADFGPKHPDVLDRYENFMSQVFPMERQMGLTPEEIHGIKSEHHKELLDLSKYQAYRDLAGEIEANDVGQRFNLNALQRKMVAPEMQENPIFRFNRNAPPTSVKNMDKLGYGAVGYGLLSPNTSYSIPTPNTPSLVPTPNDPMHYSDFQRTKMLERESGEGDAVESSPAWATALDMSFPGVGSKLGNMAASELLPGIMDGLKQAWDKHPFRF